MGQYTVSGSGADCKSAGETLSWFDSNLAHQNGHFLWDIEFAPYGQRLWGNSTPLGIVRN